MIFQPLTEEPCKFEIELDDFTKNKLKELIFEETVLFKSCISRKTRDYHATKMSRHTALGQQEEEEECRDVSLPKWKCQGMISAGGMLEPECWLT